MKKYSFIISTVVLCLLFWRLSNNYSDRFEIIDKDSTVFVNLAPDTDSIKIAAAISNLDGFDTSAAKFVAKQIAEKLQKQVALNSLSDLNKRVWQIPSAVVDSMGDESYKTKLAYSKKLLGQDSLYAQNKDKQYRSDTTLNSATNGVIKVYVLERNDKAGQIAKLLHKDESACKNVLVRLSEHYMDSLTSARETLAWARTDESGVAVFRGLDVNKSYSVIPINEGFEYGTSQGTTSGSLMNSDKNGEQTYTFYQQEHRIRMFEASTLAQIKEHHILTVRSLQEYKSTLIFYIALFFVAWWGLYILWYLKHKNKDNSVIAILMFLTGLCLLTMFSVNDPLEDTLLGVEMAQGVIYGVVIIGLLQFVNFTKLYQNKQKIGFDILLECIKWLFKPFRRKIAYLTRILSDKKCNVFQKVFALLFIVVCLPLLLLDVLLITKLCNGVETQIGKLPKGCGYLIAALLLTALLWSPIGSEVGGMKVNLNLFGIKFQPSEISKYLIVFFMAAFFSLNANRIIKYSDKGNVGLFGNKLKMLTTMILGLGGLMLLYLILGDMGPALVLAFTFIILYSIVKSKVELGDLDVKSQNARILTCDLAMLVYGVISFIVCLYVGNLIGHMFMLCLGWFVLWIALGLVKKRVYESAILFNFIISAFIFGGSLLTSIPNAKLNSIGERLESRNEMCTNTWGTLPIDGMIADAGENTQVAEGLWGLASGGLTGQGLGNGSPNFIPAFHTDMILESIGEQLGFLGVLAIILLLAILLRKTVLIGFRATHPFAFYLCLGIAIVTAVQFIIISLGSTGFIPLTGVAVPFLSYGKVSMILNLAAFGIILSYSHVPATNEAKKRSSIGKYNYSVSLLSWVFCGVALLICGVFLKYQCIDRDSVLIRSVYVNNAEGVPVVEYNPRINQITSKMWAGDIYDRNGVLLATSDKSKLADYKKVYEEFGLQCDTTKSQRRYYPFGEHLVFMLGKYGSDIYPFMSENSGYMAEYRHMSELRGYDNKKYDDKGNPLKVTLVSNVYKPDKFLNKGGDTVSVVLRDYSALIPYLKAGYNSGRISRMNTRNESFWDVGKKIKPKDLYLTLDAKLQTMLQQRISEYVEKNHSHLNKLRVSVVILDAHNGDLLSSAIYPLPDENRLREEKETKVYNDLNRPANWKSYTDMDLGLIYPSAPGSTAKVLTGLAGFRKYKDEISQQWYNVYEEEAIFRNKNRKPAEPTGKVTMQIAYEQSSNCYFINLLNDKDLFDDLAFTYGDLGISINGKRSYGLKYEKPTDEWLNMVTAPRDNSIAYYKKYKESGKWSQMNDAKKPICWSWAWGQNGIDATPLAMARTISVVANNGVLPKTRFLLTDDKENVSIVESSTVLKGYLRSTASKHDHFKGESIAGKTGTPERLNKTKKVSGVPLKMNDGWYICYIDNAKIKTEENLITSPIAVAIRMERLNNGYSSNAVNLMKKVVIETLDDLKYIDKDFVL